MDGNNSFALLEPCNMVTEVKNRKLIKLVSVEKIRRALKSIAKDKASRPDGFPFSFLRRYWPII